MQRNQFTFYRSFFTALQKIKKKSARADAYDAICRFALNGEMPNLETMDRGGAIAFSLIMPVLSSGRKKAQMRARQKEADPSRWEDIGRNKGEKETEIENEIEKEIEIETETETEGADGGAFERFWEKYPKKIGKKRARQAFSHVTAEVDTLLKALERQTRSLQWERDGGRFIPNPVTWLEEQRWEDELPCGIPKGANGTLGEAELENIRRMLAES